MNVPNHDTNPADLGHNLLRTGGAVAGGSILGGTAAAVASTAIGHSAVTAVAVAAGGTLGLIASPVVIAGAVLGGVAGLGLAFYNKAY
jgi:hypothetical protein